MLGILINAGNDRNGNPRRGWLIAESDGEYVGFVEEGYEGIAALRRACGNIPTTPLAIPVAPSYYKEAKRAFGGR